MITFVWQIFSISSTISFYVWIGTDMTREDILGSLTIVDLKWRLKCDNSYVVEMLCTKFNTSLPKDSEYIEYENVQSDPWAKWLYKGKKWEWSLQMETLVSYKKLLSGNSIFCRLLKPDHHQIKLYLYEQQTRQYI
jgi:hypothetical protein